MLRKLDSLAVRIEKPAYAAFRIVVGGMFCVHGMQKIFGWVGSAGQPPVGSQLWVGGIIELVCGALVAIGFFTRPAAFLACGTMAVAYFQFHWKLDMHGWNWIPVVNKGETAVLYCFAFLFIFAIGHGIASVDARRRR
ncbi:MAG: DoxX family protein [Myxococcaceae bacterium]